MPETKTFIVLLLILVPCILVSDLPDMMKATADIQTQWRKMGEALGISTTELDVISSLESFDELRCLYELLRHWVICIGSTWGGLVGAMRNSNVKQIKIAKDLEDKLRRGKCSYILIIF